jgi:hypothetical protein
MAVQGVGAPPQAYARNTTGPAADAGGVRSAAGGASAPVREARHTRDEYLGTTPQLGGGGPRVPRDVGLEAPKSMGATKSAPPGERHITDARIGPTHTLMNDTMAREHLSADNVGHRALRGVAGADPALKYGVTPAGRLTISRDGNEIWSDSRHRPGQDSSATWANRTREAANKVLDHFHRNPYAGEEPLTATRVLDSINDGIKNPYPRE